MAPTVDDGRPILFARIEDGPTDPTFGVDSIHYYHVTSKGKTKYPQESTETLCGYLSFRTSIDLKAFLVKHQNILDGYVQLTLPEINYNIPSMNNRITSSKNILITHVYSLLEGSWTNVRKLMPKPSPGFTPENTKGLQPSVSMDNLGPINVLNLIHRLIRADLDKFSHCKLEGENLLIDGEDLFRAWSVFRWWRTRHSPNQRKKRKEIGNINFAYAVTITYRTGNKQAMVAVTPKKMRKPAQDTTRARYLMQPVDLLGGNRLLRKDWTSPTETPIVEYAFSQSAIMARESTVVGINKDDLLAFLAMVGPVPEVNKFVMEENLHRLRVISSHEEEFQLATTSFDDAVWEQKEEYRQAFNLLQAKVNAISLTPPIVVPGLTSIPKCLC